MQRYTDHELENLLNDTESDLAERKKNHLKVKRPRKVVKQFAPLPMICPITTNLGFFSLAHGMTELHPMNR